MAHARKAAKHPKHHKKAAAGAAAAASAENITNGLRAIVSAETLSADDLEDGMELAGIAGQLWAVSDVVRTLGGPAVADFLSEKSADLKCLAVGVLLRAGATRALATAIADTAAAEEAVERSRGPAEDGIGLVALDLATADEAAEADALSSAATDDTAPAESAAERRPVDPAEPAQET